MSDAESEGFMSVLCVFLVYMILLSVSSALNPFYSSSVFIHDETAHYLIGNLYFHDADYARVLQIAETRKPYAE